MATNTYIKISAIYKKLKSAETDERTIYIHAPVGYGKTAAIHYYYRKQKPCYLTGTEGYLQVMPDVADIKESTVVIDDLSWITDPTSQEYITSLISNHKKHVVLAGRGHVPAWLKVIGIEEQFLYADMKDLLFSKDDVRKALEKDDVVVTEEEVAAIYKDSQGNGLIVKLAIYRIQGQVGTHHYGIDVRREIQLDMFHYLEHAFFYKCRPEIQELLLAISEHKKFDITLAQMLTGDSRVAKHINEMQAVGDFIYITDDGSYELHFALVNFLKWKRQLTWNEEEYKVNHEHAGLYYEIRGNVLEALHEYSVAGKGERIRKLLIENAKKHPGVSHFYKTRKYYLKLPEKEILAEPVLMAGLSMLYSHMLQPDMSEYWYGQLAEFEKNQTRGSRERKEAKSLIAYLDLALPHRGIKRLTEILRNVAILYKEKEISIPEFSITSNLPSVMNGGKDFCEWSKNDRDLLKVLKIPIELVLGKTGAGLMNTALAESIFEKGGSDDYELLTLLNAGYTQAELKGKIEICFAAAGILSKLHMRHNQPDVAAKLIEEFEKKAVKEDAVQLISNIHALKTWIALQCGRTEAVEKWLLNAPNENQEFYILDRYCYLIKLRSYILFGKYEEAWNLSERLSYYFVKYGRHYMEMENTYLRAILLYRQGETNWKQTFEKALRASAEYHFTWVAAKEGPALMPLMNAYKEEEKNREFFKSEYGQEVYRQTAQMACSYPAYLMEHKILTEPLTETEERVLRMHCMGLTSEDIIKRLCIQYSTLKFHNNKIFRNLGVKNRQEAIHVAKTSGLIQTG